MLAVAAGIWMPTAEQIALLRDDIDRRPYRIKEILTDAGIRRRIFSNVPDDEEKAVDAFFELNQNGALKTRPKVGVQFPWSNPVPMHTSTIGSSQYHSLFLLSRFPARLSYPYVVAGAFLKRICRPV